MQSENKKLALNGGAAVTEQPIPYHRPSLGEAEASLAAQVIRSQQVAGPGEYSQKVEKILESKWDCQKTLTTTSCTHALELAMLAINPDAEAEVIIPTFTYVSTALAVLRVGAKPVFADINPETLMLSPETIDKVKTENTAGIIFVHYGGACGPMPEIIDYCSKNNIFCVEDAAQCFDTSFQDQPAATFGRFGAFSFHGTKSIACGEGGLLVVNNPEDKKSCEMIRDKGTDRSLACKGDVDRYTWRSNGSSYVLSNILASVLYKQLERWPQIKKERLSIQQQVRTLIADIDTEKKLKILKPPAEASENGHITAFLLPEPNHRDWFLNALQAEGIQAREHYHPLHLSPYAREHLNPPDKLPTAERLSASLIRIPAYPGLNREDIEKIHKALKKVYSTYLDKSS